MEIKENDWGDEYGKTYNMNGGMNVEEHTVHAWRRKRGTNGRVPWGTGIEWVTPSNARVNGGLQGEGNARGIYIIRCHRASRNG